LVESAKEKNAYLVTRVCARTWGDREKRGGVGFKKKGGIVSLRGRAHWVMEKNREVVEGNPYVNTENVHREEGNW